MIIEGLPFIALRRYRPLIFDRYGQWSVTIELSGQTLQFSDVMGTVSFCIHFFEPYRLAAIKGGCVRSLLSFVALLSKVLFELQNLFSLIMHVYIYIPK